MPHSPQVIALIPARNEVACIAKVIEGLLALRHASGAAVIDRVVVADNASTDGTGSAARAAGAQVVQVPVLGYGQACWVAVQTSAADRPTAVAALDILLFVDGDGAAAAADAPALLAALAGNADLVIGVRHRRAPGSMTAPQRWGNALACSLMRGLWRMPVTDLGPYRAIRRSAFDRLDLQDRTYGWTVEMQVRAHRLGLVVRETPVGWHARQGGVSKISGTVRGVALAAVGILGMIARLWWRERGRPSPYPRQAVSAALPLASDADTSPGLRHRPVADSPYLKGSSR